MRKAMKMYHISWSYPDDGGVFLEFVMMSEKQAEKLQLALDKATSIQYPYVGLTPTTRSAISYRGFRKRLKVIV